MLFRASLTPPNIRNVISRNLNSMAFSWDMTGGEIIEKFKKTSVLGRKNQKPGAMIYGDSGRRRRPATECVSIYQEFPEEFLDQPYSSIHRLSLSPLDSAQRRRAKRALKVLADPRLDKEGATLGGMLRK